MHGNQINSACDKAITELSKGNQEALSVIYDCMARIIFSAAYTITGNCEDAEDVLQDTMIEITRYAHTYESGSNARAWILTMARHLSIDIVRKRKPTLPLEEAERMEMQVDESQLEVLDLLKILDEDEKQLVVFRLYGEMSYREISRVMEISVAAAQKRYQRAMKKLKKYL